MDHSEKLGKRIARARGFRDMTADQLVALLSIQSGGTYIGRYEHGNRSPQLDTFIEICNALKISSDWLLADYLTALKTHNVDDIPDAKQEVKVLVDLLSEEDAQVIKATASALLINHKKRLEIDAADLDAEISTED